MGPELVRHRGRYRNLDRNRTAFYEVEIDARWIPRLPKKQNSLKGQIPSRSLCQSLCEELHPLEVLRYGKSSWLAWL